MKWFAGSYTKWITPEFGGHGEGIYTLDFDPATGEIKIMNTHYLINPSYLTIVSNVLYTFNEVSINEKPLLYAFRINSEGQLKLINSVPINGSYPCHITHSGKHNCLFVSCYGSGSFLVYPVNFDGSVVSEVHNFQHNGHSKHLIRQSAPHVHCITVSENGREVFIADLGIDRVMIYTLENEEKLQVSLKSYIQLPPGSGPRHLVLHPDGRLLFVVTELTAEIFLIDLYSEKIINSLMLPADTSEASAAAIKISKDGRYIYISERVTHKIFVVEYDNTKQDIKLIDEVKANVLVPRDFLLDSTGTWLVAAGQASDSLSVFKRDKVNGRIKLYKTNENFTSLSCLVCE